MVDPHRLEKAYQTALAALLAERHPDGYWVGELSTSALSTAVAVTRPGAGAESDRRPRLLHSADRRRSRLARGPSELRRRLGRHGQELQQHLHDHARTRRFPPHRRGGSFRRLSAPGRRLVDGAPRQDARRAGRGRPRPLRQGPHLLRADPDDQRPGWIGRMEGSAVAAVRAGLFPAVVVSLFADPGCQLRFTGPHRHRPGGASPPAAVEPDRAAGAENGDPQKSARAGDYPAEQRRLPRSGAVDGVRHAGLGEHRPGGPSGGKEGGRIPGAISAAGRQLADRHEPVHMGDDAFGQRAGGSGRPGQAG